MWLWSPCRRGPHEIYDRFSVYFVCFWWFFSDWSPKGSSVFPFLYRTTLKVWSPTWILKIRISFPNKEKGQADFLDMMDKIWGKRKGSYNMLAMRQTWTSEWECWPWARQRVDRWFTSGRGCSIRKWSGYSHYFSSFKIYDKLLAS